MQPVLGFMGQAPQIDLGFITTEVKISLHERLWQGLLERDSWLSLLVSTHVMRKENNMLLDQCHFSAGD